MFNNRDNINKSIERREKKIETLDRRIDELQHLLYIQRLRRDELLELLEKYNKEESEDWKKIKGLTGFTSNSFFGRFVGNKRCAICFEPLVTYTCPKYPREEVDYGMMYKTNCDFETCGYYRLVYECTLQATRKYPEEHFKKGICIFKMNHTDVCKSARCRMLWKWFWQSGRRHRWLGLNYFDLSFENKGLFIVGKFLDYLINKQKEEKNGTRKTRTRNRKNGQNKQRVEECIV